MTGAAPGAAGAAVVPLDAGGRARRHQRIARGIIALVAVALGVAQGVVWVRIAPSQQVLVYPDGSYVSLPTADYHPFDGLALMAFAGAGVGLILAVAAWRVRAIRGTGTLLTLFGSAAVSAALAYALGVALAGGADPAAVGKTGHASIVLAGADPGSPLVIIMEPLVAVAVYTFLVAWDGRPDLGATRTAALPDAQGQPGPGVQGQPGPGVQSQPGPGDQATGDGGGDGPVAPDSDPDRP